MIKISLECLKPVSHTEVYEMNTEVARHLFNGMAIRQAQCPQSKVEVEGKLELYAVAD